MLLRNSNHNGTPFSRLKVVIIIALIIVFNSGSIIYAQKRREEPPPIRERIFFGGSIGLGFGTVTDINLSPVVGFWIRPRLNIAIGPKYQFFKYYDERFSVYGGKVYSEFVILRDFDNIVPAGIHLGIFLHAENEFNSIKYSYKDTSGVQTIKVFQNSPLVGIGISQPIGQRSSINIMAVWALYDKYDIYPDPELRISFTF